MLEKLTFKNHLNETVDFGTGGLYLNINDLHSYKWDYSSKNNRISLFQRKISEKKLPIVIVPPNDRTEGNELMDRLMELADKDVLAKEAGRLIAGDYYLECYIFGNEKSKYDLQKGIFYATLNAVSDQDKAAWIKETSHMFSKESGGSGQMLDYPYDHPYDFTSPSYIRDLVNTSFSDSEFKMRIYGEVTNPDIYIGGHSYAVTGHIGASEYVEIDSREKTVTLVQSNGTRVNWFRYRDKESYIFQKIPSGQNSVAWQGSYMFQITLYEERSEPKWT